MKSVLPRRSGWVRKLFIIQSRAGADGQDSTGVQALLRIMASSVGRPLPRTVPNSCAPTRYREVVLTSLCNYRFLCARHYRCDQKQHARKREHKKPHALS